MEQVRKEVLKGKINVSRIYKSDFQKEGTQTAELKQTITTKSYYPSTQVSNSLQDNVFGSQDFGFGEKEYSSTETRVSWIDVPVGTTKEQVQVKIDSLKENAVLYKIMSNHPILSDSEKYAIDNPNLSVTKDTYANRQVVRYPAGHENEGQIVLDNYGKPQYRRVAFSVKGATDIDNRTSDPADFYASAEIKAELGIENVMENQSI